MEIKRVAKMIKKTRTLRVITTCDGSGTVFQLVGDGRAYYRIENMPVMKKLSMFTFLGLEDEIDKLDYHETEKYEQEEAEIYQDYFEDEKIMIGRGLLCAAGVRMLRDGDDIWNDTIVFTDKELLWPIKIDGDTEECLRVDGDERVIAVKSGMLLKALLPVMEINPDVYIHKLQEETRMMNILGKRMKRNGLEENYQG